MGGPDVSGRPPHGPGDPETGTTPLATGDRSSPSAADPVGSTREGGARRAAVAEARDDVADGHDSAADPDDQEGPPWWLVLADADRGTAVTDRGTASADRVAGAGDPAAAATERRWAVAYAELEFRVAESEARAWRLLQVLPESGVVVVDAAGIIQLVNSSPGGLFGYAPEELIGEPVERLVAGLHAAYQHHQRTSVDPQCPRPMSMGPDVLAVRKDGSAVPVEVNLSAITSATGPALLASIRDSSDRKLAEAELGISDERFRVYFERAPIGMAVIDLHRDNPGHFLRVNAALCALTGYSEAELLATTSAAITHPDDRDDTVANVALLAQGATNRWDTDKRYTTSTGEDRWVHFAVSVVHDANGDPSYGVSQVEDISSRKLAEARSAELFNQFAANVDLGFILRRADRDDYEYVNPAVSSIFGLDPGVFPSTGRLEEMIHPDDREAVVRRLRSGRAGDVVEYEVRIVLPGHDLRWVRSKTFYLLDPHTEVLRVATIVEDVTRRKGDETAIITARHEAEQANAAKDEFLSRLSHELRTPLNAVLGFAQLLELDDLSPKQDVFVGHILGGGRHLLAMIDDILDVTAIDAGRLDLSLETVDLDELLHDLLGLMEPLASAHDVVLRREPVTTGSTRLTADPHRLRQVLLNLLSNAIKYNRPGGTVDLRVAVDPDATADGVTIAVTDTGLGIPPDDLHRLFTAFDRLGRESTDIEGTGIGLTLSRRLVTLMGGRLEVETAVGVGSTFTVTLPAAPSPAIVDPVSVPVVTPHGDPSRSSTVLYIEDNSSNRAMLANVIEHKPSWSLVHAVNGATGIDSARAHPPTAIVLDLHLPDIDGAEVLQILKSTPATAGIPVAMLSADANPSQITRLLAAGAERYLTKPLEIAALFDFLDSTTGSGPY